jgi:uncharacterized cupredoxin-like copper-binding protein
MSKLVPAAALCLALAAASPATMSAAHEGHGTSAEHENRDKFSAGEPGNPKQRARTVKVRMREMEFEPSRIEVRKGEQIRFVLENNGTEDHEFMLATAAENRKHGDEMKKYPDMEHDDPNGKRLSAKAGAEILWKFTKAGEFEFACLIPNHYEYGMYGKVIVTDSKQKAVKGASHHAH